jgi:hypothetical protein
MAVVALKSTAITNAAAQPRVLNSANIEKGNLRESVGTIAAANGDSIGSVYRFARVRSSDRVSAVKLYCDAVTSGAMDVGLYLADGGAVVDADFFASAQSIASAILTGTEIQHESGVYGIEDIELPLWVGLGLSADPMVSYDIAGTLTAATTAAGDVSLKVQLTSGE